MCAFVHWQGLIYCFPTLAQNINNSHHKGGHKMVQSGCVLINTGSVNLCHAADRIAQLMAYSMRRTTVLLLHGE